METKTLNRKPLSLYNINNGIFLFLMEEDDNKVTVEM